MMLLHRLQILRLRVERLLLGVFGFGRTKRVVATACWSFPIYSQSFVYQELTQLGNKGYKVKFFYHDLDLKKYLPKQFAKLWRGKRRVFQDSRINEADYRYFHQKNPAKVESLVISLIAASGKSREEITSHCHFLQAFTFARLVDAYKPHYIHSYFFYEGTFFAYIASFLLDVPRGVSCYADHLLEDYDLKLVSMHLEHASVVIATSERIKRELVSLSEKANPDRILVKPNAINVASFPRLKAPAGNGSKTRKIVSVCRIDPKKGLTCLAKAVNILVEKGLDVRWSHLGGVDSNPVCEDYARKLETIISSQGTSAKISLEGVKSADEIKKYFSSADIFVAPFVETESGDKDGIPTSLLEAMSSALPVVATDAGSITEVIDDGADGIIVPQRDPEKLAAAIEELLGDDQRRAELANNGATKARSSFDVTVCEKVFHERLNEVLGAM